MTDRAAWDIFVCDRCGLAKLDDYDMVIHSDRCGGKFELVRMVASEINPDGAEQGAWTALMKERDDALAHLANLVQWGWGENAPDLAKQEWEEARVWLAKVRPNA